MTPWTYYAPDLADMGLAGQGQLFFGAWVDIAKGEVKITAVIVDLLDALDDNGKPQQVVVTDRILKSHYTLDFWKREILEHYKQAHNESFNEVTA